MANLNKFTRSGDGILVVEPTFAYQREMTIAANWKRARMAFTCSFTGMSGNNVEPTVENLVTGSTFSQIFQYGFSNGVGKLGEAGNRFIGMTSVRSTEPGSGGMGCCLRQYSTTGWGVYQDVSESGWLKGQFRIGNGTSVSKYAGYDDYTFRFGTTGNLYGLMFIAGLDCILNDDGTLDICTVVSPEQSDFTDTALYDKINGYYTNRTVMSGGWWSGSVAADLRYFHIYFPFLNNRLRIHNMMAMQLA